MPTTLVVPSSVQVFFYYFFHIVFLGHPADILARLWLTRDIAHREDIEIPEEYEENVYKAWKNFDDAMHESYRNVGVLAGLIAAATSLFFSVNTDIANTTIRTLFLTSITTAVLSAASSVSLLSTVLPNPVALEYRWGESGLGFILGLAGPSAWLSISLWTFQAALLALVWLTDETPARVVVTALIVLMVVLRVTVATSTIGFREFCRSLLGKKHGTDHRMIQLCPESIRLRREYLRKINECQNSEPTVSRTTSISSDVRAKKSRKPRQSTTLNDGTFVAPIIPIIRTGSPDDISRYDDPTPLVRVSSHEMRSARIFVRMVDGETALQSATLTVAATATATATAPMAATDANSSIQY